MTNNRCAFENYGENTSKLFAYEEPLIINIWKTSTQRWMKSTQQTQHIFGNTYPYLGMELGLDSGEEEGL